MSSTTIPTLYGLFFCFIAFMMGAVPFGFIAGRMRGIDLREKGSGNIGATNVLRVLGKGPGIAVLLLDAAKGYGPVAYSQGILHLNPWWTLAVGVSSVLGHTYSPFVRFKGGKGVATSLGVLLGLAPIIAGLSLLGFILTVAITRYVSLGSMIAASLTAILFWTLPGYPIAFKLFGLACVFFIVIRHRANIRRLLNGTENKISFSTTSSPEDKN